MDKWHPGTKCIDENQIISSYKSGRPTFDIATDFGIGRWRVARILKRNGIKLINTRYKNNYSPHNKNLNIKDEDIMALHADGDTNTGIAIKLHCPRHMVRFRLKKMGLASNRVKFNFATNIRQQIGDKAFSLLSDRRWLSEQYVDRNKTTRVIALEIGCGKKAVSSFLKRYGIPIRRVHRGMFESQFDKCKPFWYDSYWEYEIATKMDADDKVLKFVKEPFPIPYHNGKKHLYMPDFLVLTAGGAYLLEVKPDGLLPYVEDKILAASKSGFKFVVINNRDVFPWDNQT